MEGDAMTTIKIDELEARLAPIRAIYEQYRDMDDTIIDPLFVIGDGYCRGTYRRMIQGMWKAIKQAIEGR